MQMMQQEQQRLQQEEYMRQQMLLQQQQQQQAMMAQPTGYRSNNPFAPSTSFLGGNNPGSTFGNSPQQASSSFLPVPAMPQAPPQQASPQKAEQPPQQQARPARDDGQHAGLANLLARGREDGMDTFGNTGNLRKCNTSGEIATCH
jgi:epsin